jgi:hypothetical protein
LGLMSKAPTAISYYFSIYYAGQDLGQDTWCEQPERTNNELDVNHFLSCFPFAGTKVHWFVLLEQVIEPLVSGLFWLVNIDQLPHPWVLLVDLDWAIAQESTYFTLVGFVYLIRCWIFLLLSYIVQRRPVILQYCLRSLPC